MAAMRFEQVQRFILGKKIFWGYGHFKENLLSNNYKEVIIIVGEGKE